MMPCLWISLSLLYLLQHSASSDEAVSLNCTKTYEVAYGTSVTVNCSIEWKNSRDCRGIRFLWSPTNCTSENGNPLGSYNCNWDQHSYVFLTIHGVKSEENVTVEIHSNCGLDRFDAIHVRVIGSTPVSVTELLGNSAREETQTYLIPSVFLLPWVLGVFATIIVVAIVVTIFYFLIKKYISLKNKKKHTRLSQQYVSISI